MAIIAIKTYLKKTLSAKLHKTNLKIYLKKIK